MNASQVKPKRVWIDAAVVLSLAIAFFYLYGDAFRSGYLNEFGMNRDLFTESMEVTLVTGFRITSVVLMKLAKLALKPALIILIVLLCLMSILSIFIRVICKEWPPIRSIFQNDGETKKTHTWSFLKQKMRMTALIYIVISFAFAIVPHLRELAWEEGRQSAKKYKQHMNSQIDQKVKDTVLFEERSARNPKQLKGYIIYTSPNWLAIYVEGKVNIIPTSRVVQIISD